MAIVVDTGGAGAVRRRQVHARLRLKGPQGRDGRSGLLVATLQHRSVDDEHDHVANTNPILFDLTLRS